MKVCETIQVHSTQFLLTDCLAEGRIKVERKPTPY